MINRFLLIPLFNALLIIYALLPGNDFGMAIIVLTILIRILLWPLVKKQLHHQKAMRDLQPEIAKIKQKTKGDKQKESQMMMELYKEKEINPFASLGLALLQFPILIALYVVLRDIGQAGKIQEVAYPFVANMDAIKAIIADPSSFHPTLFGVVDLTKPSAVLAVLAGLVQYVQAKQLMPKDTSKSGPGASLGFNATLIFPILTVAIGLRFPAALALYWFASSAIAVLQQQIVLSEEVTLMEKLIPAQLRKNKSISTKNSEVIDVEPISKKNNKKSKK